MTYDYTALEQASITMFGAPEPKATKSAAVSVPEVNLEVLSVDERDAYERTYERVLLITSDPLKALLAAYGAVNRSRMGLAVKSQKDGDTDIVEGWGILFADTAHRDLDDTFFSRNTNYFLDFYKNAPLWYEHGQETLLRSEPIGYRVAAEIYPEHGIWVKHALDPMLPIFKAVPALYDEICKDVDNGIYAYSSDSLRHHVSGGYNPKTGELHTWPLAGISLVKRPAEPGLGFVIRQVIRPMAA